MSKLARVCLAAAVSLVPHIALAQQAPERWTFSVTPYVWLPNVDGTLRYNVPPGASGAPEVETGPNDYLQNLKAVLMLSGEARSGRWSFLTDLIYLRFGSEESSVRAVNFGGSVVGTTLDTNTKSSLEGLAWMLASGYTVAQTPRATLDVLGGLRYLRIEARSDWQLAAAVSGPGAGQTFPAAGSISRREDIWDAIVGIRGRVRLDDSWFMPYYLDVGTGTSRVTWQGLIGVGYAFKWGDALFAYRHLYYDQDDNQLFKDFRFSGPTLGASFRF